MNGFEIYVPKYNNFNVVYAKTGYTMALQVLYTLQRVQRVSDKPPLVPALALVAVCPDIRDLYPVSALGGIRRGKQG